MYLLILRVVLVFGLLISEVAVANPTQSGNEAIISDSANTFRFDNKSWKVKQLLGKPQLDESFRGMLFSPNGKLNVVSGCLYYVSQYKTDSTKSLLVTKLEQLADECVGRTKNDEVFLNAILMTDRFEMIDGDLSLFAGNDLVAKLEAVQIENQKIFFKSQSQLSKSHPKKNSAHIKKHVPHKKTKHKTHSTKGKKKATKKPK